MCHLSREKANGLCRLLVETPIGISRGGFSLNFEKVVSFFCRASSFFIVEQLSVTLTNMTGTRGLTTSESRNPLLVLDFKYTLSSFLVMEDEGQYLDRNA